MEGMDAPTQTSLQSGEKTTCERALDDERDRLHNNLAAWVWGISGVLAIVIGLYADAWMEDWGIKAFLNSRGWLAFILSLLMALSVFLGWLSQRKRWVGMKRFIPLLPWMVLIWALLLGHANWDALFGVIVCIVIMAAFMAYLAPYKYRERTEDDEDLLGLRFLYDNVACIIREAVVNFDKRGVAIVVTGPWGSGKTFFIHKVISNLKRKVEKSQADEMGIGSVYDGAFNIATIDVWRSGTLEDMWHDIAIAISDAVGRVTLCGKFIDKIAKAIHAAANTPIFSITEAVLNLARGVAVENGNSETIIARCIERSGKKCIVVLDNLDRCKTEKIYALFSLIEKLKSVKGLVVVCGIAVEEFAVAQDSHRKTLGGTLLKLFDFSIPLPLLKPEQRTSFVQKRKETASLFESNSMISGLPLRTPREIESVARQMNVIQKCYLNRLGIDSDNSNSKRYEAILFFMAIRTLFPHIASYMEEAVHEMTAEENPSNDEASGNIDLDSLVSENCAEEYNSSHVLRMLLKQLKSLAIDDQYDAVRQSYLTVSYPTLEECDDIIHRSYTAGESPLSAIRNLYRGAYAEVLEPKIYMDFLEHALTNKIDDASLSFLSAALEQDVLCTPSRVSLSRVMMSDLYRLLLNAIYLLAYEGGKIDALGGMTQRVGDLQDLRSLFRIASSVLEQFREGTGDSEGKMFDWFHGIFDVYMAKQRAETSDAAESCRRVFALLLSSYVKRVCESLLTPNPSQRERMLWIIGRFNAPDDYRSLLQEAVKNYVSSSEYRASGLSHEQIADALLHNMMAVPANPEEKPVPLCAMSFAIIWDALRRKHLEGFVPNDELTQYIHGVQEALREQKQNLENSEQAREWSDNFRNDRRDAIVILDNGLKEILNHSGE